MENIQTKLTSAYEWANRRSGGVLDIFRLAAESFDQVRGAEAAASIAYYAIFSLFPLLLLLTAVVGFLLVNVEAPGEVMDFIDLIFPAARPFIQENLLEILERRGTGGVIGLIGLIWAASGVFMTLARNINRAWPGASMRNVWQGRLVGLAMVGSLVLLLFIILIASLIFDLLTRLNLGIPWTFSVYDTFFWNVVTSFLSWLFAFFIFLVLYRWLPNTRVKWSDAFWGAVVATIAWEITTLAFTWYLRSGFAQFELLYGSLGTGFAILIWIYLSGLITIFGAHISAAVAQSAWIKDQTQKAEESIHQGDF
jgi:membrane protein